MCNENLENTKQITVCQTPQTQKCSLEKECIYKAPVRGMQPLIEPHYLKIFSKRVGNYKNCLTNVSGLNSSVSKSLWVDDDSQSSLHLLLSLLFKQYL